ncbi:hypothetical protein ILUMI_22175 [Ignelater luminosus]|uniref:DDE-1 domain-containing protein n=1 Tax=Ignelater luminosus TaxID=2038154 RepID=A0A8K0CEC5_IGNLU|nr:hypothetical protein ILUMI_22175 [Ignelater luminosus]
MVAGDMVPTYAMAFKYKAKKDSTRRKVTKQELQNAIREVKSGTSLRKTAVKYNINRTTLRQYTKNEAKLQAFDDKGRYKASQIFTIAEERLLVEYLLTCSKMNYGLTRAQAMKLAFEYGSANNKRIPDSWTKNRSAGKDWFRGFLCRNPDISLRTPEATSLSRATSFNKKNVGDFFENLKSVREKYNFEPHNIYNCYETGCTTVQDCPKVLASKKSKQVGLVTSAERGTLVTLCFAVNAVGQSLPPFFIFPRVKNRQDFVSDGPEGSDGDAFSTGWMTAKSFLKFMEHFKKYSHASKENPVLLILDNHESHVSVNVIKYARDNGITMVTLPPHCSNRLQPLDVGLYSSFKSRYNSAMTNWMLSNPGKTVTIYNIPGFVKTIMSQAFSQTNILSGFRSTGIHPFNPDLFNEDDFMCSAVTDRNIPDDELLPEDSTSSRNRQAQIVFLAGTTSSSHPVLETDSSGDSESSLSILRTKENNQQEINDTNVTSASPVHQEVVVMAESAVSIQSKTEDVLASRDSRVETREDISNLIGASTVRDQNAGSILPIPSTSESVLLITPERIKPYPKCGPRKTLRRGRQPGKTKILTKTPEKYDIDDPTPSGSGMCEGKKKQQIKKKQKMAKMKEHLSGTRFSDDDEVKEAVQWFLNDMAASWYDMGIQKLPQRIQECTDRNGDYVEK